MATHAHSLEPPRLRRRVSRRAVTTTAIVACTLIGVAILAFVQPGSWYANLAKPDWTPLDWLFPLLWLPLYVAMGAAAARVRCSRHPDASIALCYFVVQLGLNAAWLPALFRSHALLVVVVASVVLWFASAATLWLFRQIDARASLMYAPVAVWATFLLALAIDIARLN